MIVKKKKKNQWYFYFFLSLYIMNIMKEKNKTKKQSFSNLKSSPESQKLQISHMYIIQNIHEKYWQEWCILNDQIYGSISWIFWAGERCHHITVNVIEKPSHEMTESWALIQRFDWFQAAMTAAAWVSVVITLATGCHRESSIASNTS